MRLKPNTLHCWLNTKLSNNNWTMGSTSGELCTKRMWYIKHPIFPYCNKLEQRQKLLKIVPSMKNNAYAVVQYNKRKTALPEAWSDFIINVKVPSRRVQRSGVLTIYAEKPESPGGKLNGTHHSVRNFPGKVGGRVRRSTFPALFGFPGRCANHLNFPLF